MLNLALLNGDKMSVYMLMFTLVARPFWSCNAAPLLHCLGHQNYVRYPNGSLGCSPCIICGPGEEPNITCGKGTLHFGIDNQTCRPCRRGYYSSNTDEVDCLPCAGCGSRSIHKNCTAVADVQCKKLYSTPSKRTHAPPERTDNEEKSPQMIPHYFVIIGLFGISIVALIIVICAVRSWLSKKLTSEFPDNYVERCKTKNCGRNFEGDFIEFWQNGSLVHDVVEVCESRWRSIAKSLGLSKKDLSRIVSSRKLEGVFQIVSEEHPDLSMAIFVAVLRDHRMERAVELICKSFHVENGNRLRPG